MLVYFASLGLTAFPLLADGQWIGGIAMTTVGTGFGSLLLLRWHSNRGWRRPKTILNGRSTTTFRHPVKRR